jgi:tripartite-type tricarboxylate transporter receptor subunit TctC
MIKPWVFEFLAGSRGSRLLRPERADMSESAPGRERSMTIVKRLFVCVFLAISGTAFADGYPAQPIKLIVPYPAGGGTDIAARWIGQKLADQLGQPVVIDNRAGASGNIGTNMIAKAAPDGYTIGMATPGPVTVGRSLYPDLPYDPQKDLVPIALANASPIVLVTSPSLPVKSLAELIALAKAKPGKLTVALVSTGSVPHLLTEMLKSAAGIDVLNVPYKGGGPAAIDVMSGQVDILFSVLPLVLPNIGSGQMHALAIANETRSALLPDVPTLKEGGFGEVVGSAWNGVVAPAGTAPDIVAKLSGALSKILAADDTKDRFAMLGMEAAGGSQQSFARFLTAESDKWAKVIKAAGIQAQ